MGLFGKKKARGAEEPDAEPVLEEFGTEAVTDEAAAEAGQAGSSVMEEVPDGAGDAASAAMDADYYDWKARYRPRADAGMMMPVLAGAAILGLLALVLLYFVFHPIW